MLEQSRPLCRVADKGRDPLGAGLIQLQGGGIAAGHLQWGGEAEESFPRPQPQSGWRHCHRAHARHLQWGRGRGFSAPPTDAVHACHASQGRWAGCRTASEKLQAKTPHVATPITVRVVTAITKSPPYLQGADHCIGATVVVHAIQQPPCRRPGAERQVHGHNILAVGWT